MGKELFHLTEDRSTMIVKFTLPDALDAMEFDRLNDSLVKVLDGKAGGNWLLDLTEVSYMGSAVLGLMVNIRQQVKSAKGRLVLCGMSSRLTNIFHTCCLERLFTIVKTREEAMKSAF